MKSPTSPSAFTSLGLPSPFPRRACRLLLRSFATIPHLDALFSLVCSLFSTNTRVGVPLSPARPSDFATVGSSDELLPALCFQHLTTPSQSLLDCKTTYS